MEISYKYVKEISLVTKINGEYDDLLRISRNWISYKRNCISGIELNWSFKTNNDLFYIKFEELIDTMYHENGCPHNCLEDIYECNYNIRVTFLDNTYKDFYRNGNFYISGLKNQAKAFLNLIPQGYNFSKLLILPSYKINNINFESTVNDKIDYQAELMKYNLALAIATEAHKGQFDKAGEVYINHPIAVSKICNWIKAKTVALLHDVVEDTDITLEYLRLYFDDQIVEAVDLLTHRDNEDYQTYLTRIKRNELAKEVKKADLWHNMDLSRLSNPTEEDFARVETKYKPAFRFLNDEPNNIQNFYIDKIEITLGDITTYSCDAIINAANSSLAAGGGVCGAIFDAAGYFELQEACNIIGHCKTGQAVITPGFKLKAKYVIHAVGPIYRGESSAPYLKSTYDSIIKVAIENNLKSIAIPSISTGIYGYPKEEAVKIALETIINSDISSLDKIYLVCFNQEMYDLYINEIKKYK